MKQKLENKRYKKLVLLFLAALIVFGSIPSAAMMHGSQSEEHIDEHIYFDVLTPPTEGETISESRSKYLELLRGGYNNYQLRHRFRELFGDTFSGEYIFHNYRTIFDLREDEIIDSAFLRVLSGYRIDFRFQDTGNDGLGRSAYGDGIVRIFPGSDMSDIQAFGAQDFDDSFFERMFADAPVPEFVDYSETFDQQNDADAQMRIEPFSSNVVSISVVSRTNTSITVNLQFQNSNSPNNALSILDPRTATWRWELGANVGQPPARNGNYTIENLSPGVTYFIEAGTRDATSNMWVVARTFAVTTLPAQQIDTFYRSSVTFNLDRTFSNALGADLRNRFLDTTNQAFYSLHTLVGGPRPPAMQINHVRDNPWWAEGLSGRPITWQLYNTHNVPFFYALDAAERMRYSNVATTEIPIHELGHNFDNPRWSFDTEVIAVLFTYYYYATTNHRMAMQAQSRIFTGDEFRTYMRSYAYRGLGHINHQEAMRRGVYSSYSLAYVLGSIAGQIGWGPFTNTFYYFRNLHELQVPQSNLGKLNLFLTRLRHYSGRDVIAMIPADARAIYQQHFGGAIRYVTSPRIITPAENARLLYQEVLVSWDPVPGASYYSLFLRNLCLDIVVIDNLRIEAPHTGIWLRQDRFSNGQQFRVAVSATVDGNTGWDVREFYVLQAPTTFSIRYVNNLPNTTGTLPNQKLNIQTGVQHRLADNRGNLHRPGFILVGWSLSNTNLTMGNPDFTLGQEATIPNNVIVAAGGDVVLHAHWQSTWHGQGLTMPVTGHIYYDALFDTAVFANATVYRQELHNITHRAARSFERTFGIVMLVPTPDNMVQVRSQKNYCDTGVPHDFVCSCTGVNLPGLEGHVCTQHHSSGNHMINHVIPAPLSTTGSGLHTMFFAGTVCGWFRGENNVQVYEPVVFGIANLGGNRSINSTSFEGYSHTTWYSTRILQHEWSHNYLATDGGCLLPCVMTGRGWFFVKQDVYNVWCYACRVIIMSNRDRHSG